MKKTTQITKDEELSLLRAWQTERDEEAFKALLRAHEKFCRKVAHEYKHKDHDLSLDDLDQHGRIGLMIAADKFDLNSDKRFLTYAGYYIRGEIQKAIDYHGYTVHQSVPTLRRVRKLDRLREKFYLEAGRYPGLNELSSLSGLKPKDVAEFSAMSVASVSLDKPQQSLNGKPMLDFLNEDNIPQPAEAAEFKEFMEKIYQALEKLDPKEQKIIGMHFLSDEWDESTYKELGSQIGVSKAHAFRIEKAALKKLRALVAPEFS